MNLFSVALGVGLTSGLTYAQTTSANAAYLELGGNGLFSSLNYERQLTTTPALQLHVGIGFYSEKTVYLSVPLGLTYLIKLKAERSFIDTGLGLTWAQTSSFLGAGEATVSGESFLSYVPSVGYRHYSANQFMWRLSLSPIINHYGVVPWAGLSLGRRF